MLKIAVQMDPIMHIDPKGDSTFALMREAQSRGFDLFHYHPDDLCLRDGVLSAHGQEVEVLEGPQHARLGATQTLALDGFDVILLRQDPPFDMSYITTTHLLEHVTDKVLVVNDPVAVRNAPEKLLVLHYPELMPPTLVTRNIDDIRAFRREFGDIIVKPLFGNGGAGVFKISPQDPNLSSLLELFFQQSRESLMVQQYLPDVVQGDKRIILADGEVIGAINRVPQPGEARSNMHVGGRAEKVQLTERDLEICAAIGPLLRQQGLVFVGIDVIGHFITEINVTSPTGLQELDRFDEINSAAMIWDKIVARHGEKHAG
ncbi:MAG: glutathione synthase [Alphaproteobacteria bacterium]|nr:glutathione synthase [Alphaproteobacteria bacterium]